MAIWPVYNTAQFQAEKELLSFQCSELLKLAATKANQCITTLINPLIERSQEKLKKYSSLENEAKIPKALATLQTLNRQLEETRALLTSIQGVITTETLQKGLSGVPLSFCSTSYVDPKKGVSYVDIPIKQLIHYSAEEVLFLLENGYLPESSELEIYKNGLKSAASLPLSSFEVIPCQDPMDSLIATLTHLKIDSRNFEEEILALKAHLPLIVASVLNVHAGWGETPPYNPSLGYVENFVHMLQMPNKDPDALSRFLTLFLILHFDHGGENLSTAVAKYVASGQGSISQALAAGMIALKTPLHGGACREAFSFIQEASQLENPTSLVHKKLEKKEVIPGFGQRVLRKEDPRAFLLKNYCEEHLSEHPLVKTAKELYQETPKILVEKTNSRNPNANVDFFSGIALNALGFSSEHFSLIFGLARMSGGILTQILDEKKKNISSHRPESIYTGPGADNLIPVTPLSKEQIVIAFSQLSQLKIALKRDTDLAEPLNQFAIYLQNLYQETEQLRPLEKQYYQQILYGIEKERLGIALRMFQQFEFDNLAENLLSKTGEAARAGRCSFRFAQELDLEFKILREHASLLGSSSFSILNNTLSDLRSQIKVFPSLRNFETEINFAFDLTEEEQTIFLSDLFHKIGRHFEDSLLSPLNVLANLVEELATEPETPVPRESFMNPEILLKLLITSFLPEEEKSQMIQTYLSVFPVPSSTVAALLEGIDSPGSSLGIALMLDRLSQIQGVRGHGTVHESYGQQQWIRVHRT